MKHEIHTIVENFTMVRKGQTCQFPTGTTAVAPGDMVFCKVTVADAKGENPVEMAVNCVAYKETNLKPWHFASAINAMVQAIEHASDGPLNMEVMLVEDIPENLQ